MSAWVAVFKHPYFGVTKEDGTFTLPNVPDGSYDVTLWHEKLGEQEAKVTVKGGKGELNYTMKPAEEADARPTNEKVLTLSVNGVAGEACCDEKTTAAPAVAQKK